MEDLFHPAPDSSDTSEHRIVELDPAKIHPPEGNREVTPDSVTDLVASIKRDGQTQPIIVCAHPTIEGHYLALDGNRRTLSARILGKMISAMVLGTIPTARQLVKIRNNSNAMRMNASPEDIARDAEFLMEHEGMTQAEAATELHYSASQLCKIINKVRKACDEVKQAETEGRIVADVARLISTLPKDQQPEILFKVIDGNLTRDAVEALIAQIKGGKAKKGKPVKLVIAGIQFIIPDTRFTTILDALQAVREGVIKADKNNFPLSALPSLLK